MGLLSALGLGGKQLSRGDRITAFDDAARILAASHAANGEMTLRQAIASSLEAQKKWSAENEAELYHAVGEAISLKPNEMQALEKDAFEKMHWAIESAIRYA